MTRPNNVVNLYIQLDENALLADLGLSGLRRVGIVLSSGTVVSGSLLHGSLVGLDQDDHPQYVLVDGTRGVTGDLAVAGSLTVGAGSFSDGLTISGTPVSTDAGISTFAKTMTVENPGAAEDLTFFYANQALTVTSVQAVIRGTASPTVTWTVRYSSDRSATGTEVIVGGTTTTSTAAGDYLTSFDNPTIPTNSWVWLETTAVGVSVDSLAVNLYAEVGT